MYTMYVYMYTYILCTYRLKLLSLLSLILYTILVRVTFHIPFRISEELLGRIGTPGAHGKYHFRLAQHW